MYVTYGPLIDDLFLILVWLFICHLPCWALAGRIPVRLYVRSANEDFDDVEDMPLVDSWDKVSYINRPVEFHDNGKKNLHQRNPQLALFEPCK